MTLKHPISLYDKQLKIILIVGILIRVIVFIFQAPLNNDKHFQIVQFVFNHHAIPISNQFDQSYHSPLYYIIASLFLCLDDVKIVQLFSLILSIGTLIVYYWLIKNLNFITSKKCCLLFACFLPQLILYGNFISNDTLSFLIGALIFAQMYKYINEPNLTNQNILAIYLGLGLLTKGTFIAFVPVLLFLIILLNIKNKKRAKIFFFSLFVFVLIFLAIGSYKFVENIICMGRPFVHNLDPNPPWADKQRPTYSGPRSIYDVNLIKLIRYPTLSSHTKHSYPLMLYGTFWYQYIPDSIHNTRIPLWSTYFFNRSDFKGNTSQFNYLGSLIYVLALFPTSIFLVGALKILSSMQFSHKKFGEEDFNKVTFESVSLLLLIMNLLLVVYAGIKYDVWSCFQSRLLFPSFFAIVLLFNSGLDYIMNKYRKIQNKIYIPLMCLFLLFVGYFGMEIGYIVVEYL